MSSTNISKQNFNQNKEKIRAAIKEKLIEIGAYIDELPDYIMIMLVNKKPEKQMAEDLKLFLHDHAVKFSSWLQLIVNKLNETGEFNINELKVAKEKKKDLNEIAAEPELAIQIESNEFNDEDNEGQLNRSNKKNGNLDEIDEITRKVKQKRNAIQKQLDDSTSSSSTTTTTITKHEERKSSSTKKKSTVVSSIGAIIKHTSSSNYSDEDQNNERESKYDPLKPIIGNVASVIKVSERKTLPKALQPNKQILLKAVDDANNSIKSSTINHPQPKETSTAASSIKSRINFDSRDNLKEMNNNIKSRLSINKQTDEVKEEREEEEVARPIPVLETSRFDRRRIEFTNNNNNEQLQQENSDKQLQQQNKSATKFFVTLKGINESEFIKNINNNYNDENAIVVGVKRRLSDEDEDMIEEEEFMDYEGEYEDVLEEEEEEEVEEEDDIEAKKKKIRCTYWPACDKGPLCPYLHPNKPCEAFPNCPFGNKCHYLHPSCRFDGYCTRADCIYTHIIKPSTIGTSPGLVQLVAQQPSIATPLKPNRKSLFHKTKKLHIASKYPIDHTKTAEATKKPEIDCKFGKLCKNPFCTYAHPHIPKKSALKWTATSSAAGSHAAVVTDERNLTAQASVESMKVE